MPPPRSAVIPPYDWRAKSGDGWWYDTVPPPYGLYGPPGVPYACGGGGGGYGGCCPAAVSPPSSPAPGLQSMNGKALRYVSPPGLPWDPGVM